MSVVPPEICLYGSANMPEADGSLIGGAVDLSKKVTFYDIPVAGTFDVVSSSASDTATKVQVTGRASTGAIVTPSAVTLTGTTLIAGTFGGQSFERILAGVTSGGVIATLTNPGGTAAVGDVAVMATTRAIAAHTAQTGATNKTGTTPALFKLQAGDGATIAALTYAGLGLIIRITGGTGASQLRSIAMQYSAGTYGTDIVAVNRDWTVIPDNTSTYDIAYGLLFEILPNQVKAITRAFATAAADVLGGYARTFYEKVFWLNTNIGTSLTGAAIQVLSESPSLPGSALLDLALCKMLNDTATAADRQTLPTNGDGTALTFVAQPSPISVIASPGSLPNGNAASVAQGAWLRLTLPAGASVYKSTGAARVTGTTT